MKNWSIFLEGATWLLYRYTTVAVPLSILSGLSFCLRQIDPKIQARSTGHREMAMEIPPLIDDFPIQTSISFGGFSASVELPEGMSVYHTISIKIEHIL